jgi:hypothetical protein
MEDQARALLSTFILLWEREPCTHSITHEYCTESLENSSVDKYNDTTIKAGINCKGV